MYNQIVLELGQDLLPFLQLQKLHTSIHRQVFLILYFCVFAGFWLYCLLIQSTLSLKVLNKAQNQRLLLWIGNNLVLENDHYYVGVNVYYSIYDQ